MSRPRLTIGTFGDPLTLREIGVARCDQFIKMLAQQSYKRPASDPAVVRVV